MKRPALKPEDGAQFRGGVTEVEPRLYRARCYAQLDSGSHIDTEAPDYEMCDIREGAIAWIERAAAARGFSRYVLEAA